MTLPHFSEPLHLDGTLRRVDLINREIEVMDQATQVTLIVPPDCKVFLHGERVKLRLLLPGDRLRVTCHQGPDALEACVVEAQSVR